LKKACAILRYLSQNHKQNHPEEANRDIRQMLLT
jgi:hypothetical protein